MASVLLPKRLRQPFYDVYAFCRTADDVADESESPQAALQGLHELQNDLDQTFSGNPPANMFLALADTARAFNLPKQPFDDLLSAFRQDQSKTSYETFDELLDYCRRSANPVGRIVLQLGDAYDDANAALSDKICTGLQLANFWQDIARDQQIGRTYLPQDEMQRFGVTQEMLTESSTPDELKRLLKSECDRAESLFEEGVPLADQIPKWLAKDIKLFAHGGLATLDAIRSIDFDVLRMRPKVSKAKQMLLVLKAILGRI